MKSCRRLTMLLLVLLILVAIGGFIGYNWLNSQIYNPTNASDTSKVKFTVASGESVDSIATKLNDAKLINSRDAFLLYVRLMGLRDDIKAGDFQLSPSLNSAEIAQKLTEVVERETVWFTITEGQRITEIIPNLRTQLTGKSTNLDFTKLQAMMEDPETYMPEFSSATQEFLRIYKPTDSSLEGFLYPDTYNIHTDITGAGFIDLLINTLNTKLTTDDKSKIQASDRSFYQLLIIASILDWEANKEEDYKIVAGIMFNRISRNMRLDVDATTLYGLGRRTPPPTASELASTSNKYNLRALPGLTPTPIGNPGIVTIRAVLNPTPTDFLYYITGNDGKMYYAKTLSEHNRNIQNHL
jgi:UPF0755 protein